MVPAGIALITVVVGAVGIMGILQRPHPSDRKTAVAHTSSSEQPTPRPPRQPVTREKRQNEILAQADQAARDAASDRANTAKAPPDMRDLTRSPQWTETIAKPSPNPIPPNPQAEPPLKVDPRRMPVPEVPNNAEDADAKELPR